MVQEKCVRMIVWRQQSHWCLEDTRPDHGIPSTESSDFPSDGSFGHFGRKEFPWERTDKVLALQDAIL